MPRIGLPELIIILVIVLLVFGAGRLPEIGKALGKGIRSFKQSVSVDDEQENKGGNVKPETKEHEKTPPSITSH